MAGALDGTWVKGRAGAERHHSTDGGRDGRASERQWASGGGWRGG
jgi:hypothetical protein